MTRENIINFKSAEIMLNKMLRDKLINDVEYKQSIKHLAKKHCIKFSSIYVANDLTNLPKRVIYMNALKGGVYIGSEGGKNRTITKITEKN